MEPTPGFSDALALKIFEAINKKPNISKVINEDVSVFPYFFNLPISPLFTNDVVIGGLNLPMVALIGGSGRVYFFALRALLSEEDIKDALK